MTTYDQRVQQALAVREKLFGSIVPQPADDQFSDFSRLINEFVFGSIWPRPGLDMKTRSLCTLAALIVLEREPEVRLHLRGALNLGIPKEQVAELIMHLAIYGGFPVAVNAMRAAREVWAEYEQAQSKASS